ncbi:MAG: DNA-3-methyladenine glycosylase I, partial [Betaproteobacteria bacterium HGW-Betaproteobacteria-21]
MSCRCAWVSDDPLYLDYHDHEWGVPLRDPRALFEFLLLEGAQAGLSWITVLRKRARYRAVFDGFDPALIACWDDAKRAELMSDPGIIRNRAK